MREVRIVGALLQEDLADEQLTGGDLHEAPLKRQIRVATVLSILACLLGRSDVRKTVLSLEESVNSSDFRTGDTID